MPFQLEEAASGGGGIQFGNRADHGQLFPSIVSWHEVRRKVKHRIVGRVFDTRRSRVIRRFAQGSKCGN
jgi:hypothetical protein